MAASREFSAVTRFSPAACSGPEFHERYCCRQACGGVAAGAPPDPTDAAEPPPDPQAVNVSPAASAALARMALCAIGVFSFLETAPSSHQLRSPSPISGQLDIHGLTGPPAALRLSRMTLDLYGANSPLHPWRS